MLCKICNIVVPRRRNHQPTVCEACQRFFRRNYQRYSELTCLSGKHACEIDVKNKKLCKLCRLDKCIRRGMTRRSQTSESKICSSTDSSASSHFSRDSPCSYPSSPEEATTICQPQAYNQWNLVQDPILYNGSLIELRISDAVEAFTYLHSMNFGPLKKPDFEIHDMDTFFSKLISHSSDCLNAANQYCSFISDRKGLSEIDKQLLIQNSMHDICFAFNALPCSGSNPFFGLNTSVVPFLKSLCATLANTIDQNRAVPALLNRWNPNLVECSILLSLLVFNEKSASLSPSLAYIRRQLQLGLILLNQQKQRQSDFNSIVATNQCINLTNKAVATMSKALLTAAHDPGGQGMLPLLLVLNLKGQPEQQPTSSHKMEHPTN